MYSKRQKEAVKNQINSPPRRCYLPDRRPESTAGRELGGSVKKQKRKRQWTEVESFATAEGM
jgi:hypothetical protein